MAGSFNCIKADVFRRFGSVPGGLQDSSLLAALMAQRGILNRDPCREYEDLSGMQIFSMRAAHLDDPPGPKVELLRYQSFDLNEQCSSFS